MRFSRGGSESKYSKVRALTLRLIEKIHKQGSTQPKKSLLKKFLGIPSASTEYLGITGLVIQTCDIYTRKKLRVGKKKPKLDHVVLT